MKLGVISASNASKILLGRGGKTTKTRDGYINELVGQILTREMAFISGRPLDWGHENELAARKIASFETGIEIHEVPVIFKDDSLRCLCSPDGYGERPIEIKCPWTTQVYINFLCRGEIKPEYIDQVQYSMWVAGAESWTFANYDPRMSVKPFHSVLIERDEKIMARFDNEVPIFINEMDEMLAMAGVKFGHQWHKENLTIEVV